MTQPKQKKISSYFKPKEANDYAKTTAKKKVIVPASPKSHFKAAREGTLNRTSFYNRNYPSSVLEAPAAIGKFSVRFRARSTNQRQFLGREAASLRKVKEERTKTQFMEFNLSYKKPKAADY